MNFGGGKPLKFGKLKVFLQKPSLFWWNQFIKEAMTIAQSSDDSSLNQGKEVKVRFWINFEGKTKAFDKFLLSFEEIILNINILSKFVLGSKMFDKWQI